MYLLLYGSLNKEERDWLSKHALPVAPLAWVYNADVKGCIAVTLDSRAMQDLQPSIMVASAASVVEIEDAIKDNSLRGKAKAFAINKLRLIVDASFSFATISHAKDLLKILGDDLENKDSKPEDIDKDEELGVDIETVREYLAMLAKDPSIH